MIYELEVAVERQLKKVSKITIKITKREAHTVCFIILLIALCLRSSVLSKSLTVMNC